eukprot:scaffold22457_cov47-Attheya_sp.AAC.3
MSTDALSSSLTTDAVRTEANTSLVHQLMLPHCHMVQSNKPYPILGPDDFLNERRKYSTTPITTNNHAGESSKVVPRINGGESSSSASTSSNRKQSLSQPPQEEDTESLLWAGASQVEIDIMECCDVGPPLKPVNESDDDDDDDDDDSMEDGMEEDDDDEKEEEYIPNGCIARQMEGRFAALMARRCTSVSDRALALTVLERTIQRDASISRIYKQQEQQQQQRRNKRPRPDEASSSSTTPDGRGMAAGTASADSSNGHDNVQTTNVKIEDDDDVPLSVLKQKALENNGTDRKEAQPVDSNANNVKVRDTKDESRMKNFLAAGGLMVLNHWLIDAFTPVSVPIVSSSVASSSSGSSKIATATAAATVGETFQTNDSSPNKVDKSRKSGGRSTNGSSGGNKSKQQTITPSSKIKTQLKPSPTGPILLPLLSILESMPFDKDLVTNTKINKQIRNLKKGLNAAIAKFERKMKRGTTNNDDDSSDSSDSSDDDEDEKQPSGTTGMTATTGGTIIRKRRLPRTLKELRHPVAGGLLVWQVRKAVDTLMQSWKEKVTACVKYEKQTGKSSGVGDYYVDLKALFRERYKEIVMKHQRGEKPSLGGLPLDPSNNNKKLHASSTSKRGGQGTAGPSSSSTKLSAVPGTMDTRKRPPANGVQEMSEAQRRLREREADLKAAQKARLEAKQKMESYRKRLQEEKKRKADAEQQQQQQQQQHASSLEGQQPTTAKRRRTEKAIKWKDEVIYPGSKRREPLIQVHVYEQELDMWEADTEIGGGGEGSRQSNLSAKERRMKRKRDKKRLYKDKYVNASNDDLNIDMTTDNDAPLAEKESITPRAVKTEKTVFSVKEDLLDEEEMFGLDRGDEEEMFGLDSDDENGVHDQHGLV